MYSNTIKKINRRKAERGYTLLEFAIVIVILGLVVTPLFVLYSQYQEKMAIDVTEQNIATVTNAINQYKYDYGYYPCPSLLDVSRGSVGYGRASNCSDTAEVATNSCGAGNGNGYCVESSPRNVRDRDGNDIGIQRVRRGAIPFMTLGINEIFAYDGYGNKLTYAVTENLATGAVVFDPLAGGIDVLNTNGNSLVDQNPATDSLAHYLVVSHGEDGAGAYNKQGLANTACPADINIAQSQNCNNFADAGGAMTATYRADFISTSNDLNQQDDYVSYFTMSDEVDPWRESNLNPIDIHPRLTLVDQDFAIGTVGSDDAESEVTGGLRVDDDLATGLAEGEIQVLDNLVSDSFAQMEVLAIAGDNTVAGEGIICDDPSAPYLDGISQNEGDCVGNFTSGCPDGSFLTGFDEEGRPNCSPLPCQPTQVDICGADDGSLPLGQADDIQWVYVNVPAAGPQEASVRGIRFRCDASGNWEEDTDRDSQDDNRDDGHTFEDGNAIDDDGIVGVCYCDDNPVTSNCRANYTGDVVTTMSCPYGEQTVDDSDCRCQPYSETRTVACAVGGGTYTERTDYVCRGNRHEEDDTTITADNCTCSGTDTDHRNCYSYEKGPGITTHYSVNCITGDRNKLRDEGYCTCDSSARRTITRDCPDGQVGDGIEVRQRRDCLRNRWVDQSEVSRDCRVEPEDDDDYVWKSWGTPYQTGQSSCGGEPRLGSSCGSSGDSGNCCVARGGSFDKIRCRCLPE